MKKLRVIIILLTPIFCFAQEGYLELLEFHKPYKTQLITCYKITCNEESKPKICNDSSLEEILYFNLDGKLILYKYSFSSDTSKYLFEKHERKIDTLAKIECTVITRKSNWFPNSISVYTLPYYCVKRKFTKSGDLAEEVFINPETNKKEMTRKYFYYKSGGLSKLIASNPEGTIEYRYYYKLY